MKRKLIIIGLDGATFDVIDPLLDDGYLPSLAHLVENGTRARLLSTIPYATLPAWPSFMTGKNAGKHGVFDFFDSSGPTRRLSTSRDIHAPTLWQVLGDEGRRSVVVNVPGTYPPSGINGIVVSGMLTPTDAQFASPPEAMDYLHQAADGYRVNFRGHLLGRDLVDDVREVTEKQKKGFLGLLNQEDWDFAMIMFRATDVIQHHFWGRQDLLKGGHRLVDRCIGEILTALPDVTTMVVSDHGLQAQRRDFHINKWLIDMGYMSITRGGKTDLSRWEQISELDGRKELAQAQLHTSSTSRLLLRVGITGSNLRRLVPRAWRRGIKNSLPRSIKGRIPASDDILYDVDWGRTQASGYQLYATESKAIKIINPDGRTREELCRELVHRLEALRDPQTGTRIVRCAHRRENLYVGPYVSRAPDIVLDLHDGYNITNAFFADDYVTPRDEVRGCHHREGILIATGPDIEHGKTLASFPSLLDVAPTALHYLECAIPADCDGRVLTELFEPHSETATRPLRHRPPSEHQAPTAEAAIQDDEGQAEIEQRLRALGYL